MSKEAPNIFHEHYRKGNGPSKLTEFQVKEIRASKESYASLARKYKCSPAVISNVKFGLTYKWVK